MNERDSGWAGSAVITESNWIYSPLPQHTPLAEKLLSPAEANKRWEYDGWENVDKSFTNHENWAKNFKWVSVIYIVLNFLKI